MVVTRAGLECSNHIENEYYSSVHLKKTQPQDLCALCGGAQAERPADLQDRYQGVLPICSTCVANGLMGIHGKQLSASTRVSSSGSKVWTWLESSSKHNACRGSSSSCSVYKSGASSSNRLLAVGESGASSSLQPMVEAAAVHKPAAVLPQLPAVLHGRVLMAAAVHVRSMPRLTPAAATMSRIWTMAGINRNQRTTSHVQCAARLMAPRPTRFCVSTALATFTSSACSHP